MSQSLCEIQAVNPLNAELNPIRHLLALVGGHRILHVSRVRVNVYHTLDAMVTILCEVCTELEDTVEY